ncbi:hypothetical protein AB0D14_00345 [Streptomyces sp. NPDC048484]|uniref:hypothetical protein n=1 Tax=Streptomyces sp. NPDC048484 TaxID=3155146 RepID=UPI0034296643
MILLLRSTRLLRSAWLIRPTWLIRPVRLIRLTLLARLARLARLTLLTRLSRLALLIRLLLRSLRLLVHGSRPAQVVFVRVTRWVGASYCSEYPSQRVRISGGVPCTPHLPASWRTTEPVNHA